MRAFFRSLIARLLCLSAPFVLLFAARASTAPGVERPSPRDIEALRLAIVDLATSYPDRYPDSNAYLRRLENLLKADGPRDRNVADRFAQLRREALLANPLIDFERLLLLKRRRGQLGLPTNHQCNACLPRTGYDNEIAVLAGIGGESRLDTLYRPPGGFYVGEIDLHFDADRLLFTMPNEHSWEIHEMAIDGRGLRQVTRSEEAVDNFDGCYLPDGRIVYGSTASFTAVPCWHGKERACSLYVMNPDGSGVRQLCFDQDLDLHPAVLADGQIVYSRWDYTGIMHIYLRPLMVMNPDGTGQRAIYGSNSYYPNSLYFPRGIPGAPHKLAAILSGYHGVPRMGELVVLDTSRGWYEAEGIVHRVGHRGEPAEPIIRDALVEDSWPKFLHPYPLSERYFLTAAKPDARSSWGIYLVDVFDNMLPLAVDPAFDFFEPLPIRRTPRPPVIPPRVDPQRDDATIYLHNVYAGPGLAGVPHGAVKRLRIVAYHFGYPGMAGPDKIGRGGPWEAMRILGTVPVDEDGSVCFEVPACTPIAVQPLDGEGKALALMRSWYTAMPGEVASCVGCHEQPKDVPAVRFETAATQRPRRIEPWYGPPRGFDFEREVQPVLDRHCTGCHNGQPLPDGRPTLDLRSERFAAAYQGLPLSKLGADRLYPEVRQRLPRHQPDNKWIGSVKTFYTPAYEALIPFIRRVNVEDHVGLHVPGEYHADTSELVQVLRQGHYGVQLDSESWDRLVTWIDLNGPCHGTWNDVCEVPRGADQRRRELARQYGGPREDAEFVPETHVDLPPAPVPSASDGRPAPPRVDGWPFDRAEAERRQRAGGTWQRQLDLGQGITLPLVRIPAGDFVMGSSDGPPDESPPAHVNIPRDYWMGVCEVTNEQFRQFDPTHDSGLFTKRSLDSNGPGIDMNGPQQPVVRVSWEQAMAFCRWLSERCGVEAHLPTEAQWEYACRAGTDSPLSFGPMDADFSSVANLADAAIGRLYTVTGGVVLLQEIPCDSRFDDRSIATANVGSYRPNAWALHDMHGNAAEWTRSNEAPYPYRDEDDAEPVDAQARKVVRGGSFHDRPARCRSAFRLSYPAWQRVHNVGFRIVVEPCGELAAR